MALPLYLAQTAAEMAGNPFPDLPAYMACHFSSCSFGLSNLPRALPEGTLLILDDSTPMDGHDPERILQQLSELISLQGCAGLLLDFQRQDVPGQQELVKLLCDALPCPVGISELYAEGLSCTVFLPPAPPDRLLSEYLAPWKGREVWLEAALDGTVLTLTETCCTASPLFDFPADGLLDEKLHCHYAIETADNSAVFHLWRTRNDLDSLLAEAESLGVTRAVGLWQELDS
jgi:hypothetical protein